MTRPALIIGLGGTGQWVLTFLKKELLEIGNGSMPSGVRLLAFDTTSKTAAAAGQGSKKEDEKDVRAGAVELTAGTEFIPIGENVSQLSSEISQGQHPHLQWFPAASYLAKLPPSAFNTKEGSGQIRQMGRISVFRDLSSGANSLILSHLRAAMQTLQNRVSRDRQLEVIIIGSLAGGTGAGMLVDMALLVRAQAHELVANNYLVRGFFVLPRAFTRAGLGEDRDMLARSFAAWRELDRFMIVSERFGLRQVNYHSQNQALKIKVDKRIYDVSYMVDPARQGTNSLDNIRAEEGLYPALAQCLSAILDDKAGQAYTEFVSTNLAGKLAQLPRRPFHSAVGSYTLKVPVYYAREKFSHQLALEALDQFLAPQVNDKGRVIRLSEVRNREVADGYAGWRAARSFMSASALNLNGQEIPNTKALPLIADVREKEGQREGAIINQWAQGGLTHVNGRVLLALTDISQDDEGKVIMRNITDELQRPLYTDIPPSRVVGDTPVAAYTRITNRIPEFRHEHYGQDTVQGERLRGKYGKALDQARIAQVARFRRLLQAWTLETLNGHSEDPMVARGGKLGYVRAFYDELINTFVYFTGFLNMVRKDRNERLQLASRHKEAARKAQAFYNRERGKKCWLTFWDDFTHPDAHRAQRNYLLAEQRDIDVRKDDILLDVLAETALEMQAIAEKSRDEVDNWIAHLATGDPGLKINSLYGLAAESLANVNVNHEWDKRLSRVSQLVGEHEYKSNLEHTAEAIGSLRWQVEATPHGLRLGCGVELPSENPEAPRLYEPFRRDGENPADYNLDLLLRLGERPYQSLHKERPLAREIMKEYETGRELALALDKKAEPLYITQSNPTGPRTVACYIRVDSGLDEQTQRYFTAFENELRDRNPNIQSLTLVPSEDPHKLTIVRSDDLLPSSDFQMWHACRQAYIQQVNDPYRDMKAADLHIFPAEINACHYEAEMPGLLGQDYRTLHPEVVALLEDRERFEMFFRAVGLDLVREEVDEQIGEPYWVFQTSPEEEPIWITLPVSTLDERKEEDIFQLIHNFVMEGSDRRPGLGQFRRIEWPLLRDSILSKQRELGKAQATELYQQEIDGPDGMVQRIRKDIERRRAAVTEPALRPTIGQEHQDLADLAKTIYKKAIRSLR